MKVCILGNNLVSLTLAKALINLDICVDFFPSNKKLNISKTRTIGISDSNVNFFNKNILEIKKLLWEINKIEILSENTKDEKIIDFQKKGQNLFYIIKNYELYDYLSRALKKNKFFFQKNKLPKNFKIKNYNLVINTDSNNFFLKKYFYKKINKDYNSFAHTTVIEHKKLSNNHIATQIFTKNGPLAFLPISDIKTSIVYSVRGSKNVDLKNLIKKYNKKYSILKISQTKNFYLKSSNVRNYYFKNILAFGEILHKIHPLAGQGFNMSLRDIKLLIRLIKSRIDNGLDLDHSICIDFEKKARHKNYLFSSGIDLIYEFFKFESKVNHSFISKSVKLLGKNKYANNFFTKIADEGIFF